MDELSELMINRCMNQIEKTKLPVLNRMVINCQMIEVDENLNTVRIFK